MLELTGKSDWTLFISSHDIEDIENLVDHVGFIDKEPSSFQRAWISFEKDFARWKSLCLARKTSHRHGQRIGCRRRKPGT